MIQVQQWLPLSRQLTGVLKSALDAWLAKRDASEGAAPAFYTAFSMAPILVLVIAVAGFFYGAEVAQGRLLSELKGLMGSQGAEAIQLVLAGAHNKDSGIWATIIATVLLLVGATTVLAELKASLDEIWHVPPATGANWSLVLRTRLLSFSLITAAMFTIGKFLIGLHIGNSGVASSFGAAGSIVALLLWVYYSAQIFFFGVDFTRQYALQLGSLRDQPKEQTGAAAPKVSNIG